MRPLPLYYRFIDVFLRDFNLSLFIGLTLLALFQRSLKLISLGDVSGWYVYAILPAFIGFFTAAVALLLNHFFARRRYAVLYYSADKFKLLITAWLAGAAAFYLSFSEAATYLITLAVMITAGFKIRHFIGKLSALLYPRRLATIADLGLFLNFFITLIISFAVINLSVNALDFRLHRHPAFNFADGIEGIVDALYFSVITMTTVGYGDLIPLSALGKIVTAFECITCYLTLGVMIGIITRGISFHKKRKI